MSDQSDTGITMILHKGKRKWLKVTYVPHPVALEWKTWGNSGENYVAETRMGAFDGWATLLRRDEWKKVIAIPEGMELTGVLLEEDKQMVTAYARRIKDFSLVKELEVA